MLKRALILVLIVVLFIFIAPNVVFAEVVDVKVTVACDEEWINIYEDYWQQAALNAIEEADKELISEFGINLYVHKNSYQRWESNDLERNLADLLDEAASENPLKEGDDILIAFTGQKTDFVGMAYVKGNACLVIHQNQIYDAIVVRHEVAHLFGCFDENPPAKNIMSEWWDFPDTWGQECYQTILKNRERFRSAGQ